MLWNCQECDVESYFLNSLCGYLESSDRLLSSTEYPFLLVSSFSRPSHSEAVPDLPQERVVQWLGACTGIAPVLSSGQKIAHSLECYSFINKALAHIWPWSLDKNKRRICRIVPTSWRNHSSLRSSFFGRVPKSQNSLLASLPQEVTPYQLQVCSSCARWRPLAAVLLSRVLPWLCETYLHLLNRERADFQRDLTIPSPATQQGWLERSSLMKNTYCSGFRFYALRAAHNCL